MPSFFMRTKKKFGVEDFFLPSICFYRLETNLQRIMERGGVRGMGQGSGSGPGRVKPNPERIGCWGCGVDQGESLGWKAMVNFIPTTRGRIWGKWKDSGIVVLVILQGLHHGQVVEDPQRGLHGWHHPSMTIHCPQLTIAPKDVVKVHGRLQHVPHSFLFHSQGFAAEDWRQPPGLPYKSSSGRKPARMPMYTPNYRKTKGWRGKGREGGKKEEEEHGREKKEGVCREKWEGKGG